MNRQEDAGRQTLIRIYRRAHVFDLAEERRVRAKGDPAGVAANSETAGRSSRAGSDGVAS